MKKIAIIAVAVLALASNADACQRLTIGPGEEFIRGHTTYTVAIEADEGPVNGFDAVFSGPLKQINPSGLPTIFTDNNDVIIAAGEDVRGDSQFLFSSSELHIDAVESDMLLRVAITNLAQSNTGVLEIAQVVIPHNALVTYDLSVEVPGNPCTCPINGVFPVVPEPASAGLISLPCAGILGIRRRSLGMTP